jgi:hypothetical protein
MKKNLMFVTALALILSCAGIASADQLAVNGTGLDPTRVGTTGFTLSETSNGATTMTDIVFLFSVPSGFGAPTGLSASAGTFGTVSWAGSLTNTGCHDVYTCVGISGGTNSNNFANFSGYESSINGITATSFDIYEVTLSGVDLGPKGSVSVTGTFGVGTFIDGYGVGSGGDSGYTPFTVTGLTTNVPEPASMTLLGLGLLGVPFLRRKK